MSLLEVQDWIKQAARSVGSRSSAFETAHLDELFPGYVPELAIALGHSSMEAAIGVLSDADCPPGLAARLAFVLKESTVLSTDLPLIENLDQNELDNFTPPSLYVMSNNRDLYVPYLQEFRSPLAQTTHNPLRGCILAWYSCSRSPKPYAEEPFGRAVYIDYIPSQ